MKHTEEYYKALAAIEAGEDPKLIAERMGVKHSTVMRWRYSYETAKQEGTLESLLDPSKLSFVMMAENLVPAGLKQSTKELAKGIKGLDRLKDETQEAALAIIQKLKILSARSMEPDELNILTESLCSIQNAFFNKNSVSLNVQNNYVEGSKYNKFLSDKPNEKSIN